MDHLILLGTLLIVGGALFLAMCRWPKVGAVTWVCIICFVPIWFGVVWHATLQAHVVVGLLVAVSFLIRARRVRVTAVDVTLLVVLLLIVAEYLLHMTTLSFAFVVLTQWLGAFLVGRLITEVIPADWAYGLIAVAFSAVGVLAVIEFVTSTNLFITHLPQSNALFQTWGTLQPRGNIVRAEGAFGHSIALGTSLAVAIGLTMVSRFRPWVRLAMVLIMLAGSVVSFSRTGMLCSVLVILLVTVLGRRSSSLPLRLRATLLGLLVVGGAVAAGFVVTVFNNSNEARGSADYRADLLALVHTMQPLSLSPAFAKSTSSTASLGEFGSIDDAALLFGLSYGWIPLVLAGLCWLTAVVLAAARRASVPTLIFVALTPAFVTVALITQYAAIVWFVAGLAVSTQAALRSKRDESAQDPGTAQSRRTVLSP